MSRNLESQFDREEEEKHRNDDLAALGFQITVGLSPFRRDPKARLTAGQFHDIIELIPKLKSWFYRIQFVHIHVRHLLHFDEFVLLRSPFFFFVS